MLLLVAAFAAFPMGWRRAASGIALGLLLIWLLNQGRIVALFYAVRHDLALFNLLHGYVLPLVIVAAGSLFYLWWASRGGKLADGPA
jgi:exosortase/archaeosortase family protein